MKQGVRLIVLGVVLIAVGLTVRLWGPTVYEWLKVESDVIQSLDALVGSLITIGGLAAGYFGWRKTQEGGGIHLHGNVNTGGGDFVVRDKKVEGGDGSIVIDGDLIMNLGSDSGRKELASEIAGKYLQGVDQKGDLKQATQDYYDFLLARYRYLNFRGMGVSDRVPLEMPLLELYVPLRARRELPKGETWKREHDPMLLGGREAVDGEGNLLRLGNPEPVVNLLTKNGGLVLLGDPGAGKTTFLKYLALVLAAGQGEQLGLGNLLPVLVALSGYANALRECEISLEDYIVQRFNHQVGSGLPMEGLLKDALERGTALVLLDGLDEVRETTLRHKVVNRVENFYSLYQRKGSKFVVTSRVVGYKHARLSCEKLVEATLVDFDQDEIELFVEKWTAALERKAQEHEGLALAAAEKEQAELLHSIQHNAGVKRLAANPLLLTILCLMKRQGVTLPERRVQLYDQYVRVLLSTWNRARGLDGPAPGRDVDEVQTIRLLAPLALWMHRANPGVGLVNREDLRRELLSLFEERGEEKPEAATERFLLDVHDYTCLLLERGPGEYGFIHLTFEEYLAGVGIALQGQGQSAPIVDEISQVVGEQPWREVSLLAVGYVGIIQQLERVAGEVVDALIAKQPGPPGEAVLLAGEAVLDAGSGGVPVQSKKRVMAALEESMLRVQVPAALRLRIGDVLGQLGDHRRGVNVIQSDSGKELPDIDWVSIPAGGFLMGSTDEDKQAFAAEKDQHPLDLPAYWIGRYPVTNQQYAPFIAAGGYEEKRFWTTEGWAWRQGAEADLSPWDDFKDEKFKEDYKNWLAQRTVERRATPWYWQRSPWNGDNRPVVGVCWYETLAYCRWLTEQLQTAGLEGLPLQKDFKAGLPSEAQWEKAVRGTQGNIFPWGNEWREDAANTEEAELKETSPVGIFPGGRSEMYGLLDGAGNVWEWTLSRWGKKIQNPVYGYPYDPTDGREELSDIDFRVLRGGSWDYNYWDARCASRGRNAPVNYDLNVGFRVALSPDFPLK